MIYLRELLISIEKYFILEDLETFYYLSDFENNKYMESKFNKVNQSWNYFTKLMIKPRSIMDIS